MPNGTGQEYDKRDHEAHRKIEALEKLLTDRREAPLKDHDHMKALGATSASRPPDASPIAPPPSALPDIFRSASLYFGGAPNLYYAFSSSANTHTVRIDSQGQGVTIALNSPEAAHRFLHSLEQTARELRRRLDLSAGA